MSTSVIFSISSDKLTPSEIGRCASVTGHHESIAGKNRPVPKPLPKSNIWSVNIVVDSTDAAEAAELMVSYLRDKGFQLEQVMNADPDAKTKITVIYRSDVKKPTLFFESNLIGQLAYLGCELDIFLPESGEG